MIETDQLKREFQKIRDASFGKKPDVEKGTGMLQQLQAAVIDDICKTGDQHTRQLLRMLQNFMMEFQREANKS